MEYNMELIGDRIRAERKKRGWNQDDLIEKLSQTKMRVKIGRNSISKIESPSKHDLSCFRLDLLIALSELFDCEIGYLLGEYDCTTGRNTDVKEETGLNESSIGTLKAICKYWDGDLINVVNYILQNTYAFIDFLRNLSLYMHNEYTTPLFYDPQTGKFVDCSYHTATGDGITFGKQEIIDNKGTLGWRVKGVSTNILESHAILQLLNIIYEWKKNYNLKEGAKN